jgi:hypothetical protein
MIPHVKFGQLRLKQFLPNAEIAELEDWEYEERVWVGEAVGFSEWLRPVEDPEILGSLSINFKEFPERAADQVLKAIELPLKRGMTADNLKAVLGEPVETLRFVPGKVTYGFMTPEPYKVSCTVEDEGGLIFLEVMIPG